MRALWISTSGGSGGAIQPDIELAHALGAAGVEIRLVAPEASPWGAAAAAAGLERVGSLPRGWLGRRRLEWLRQGCRQGGIELVHLWDRAAALVTLPALQELPLDVVLRHDRPGGTQRWNPLARLTLLSPSVAAVACTAAALGAELARRRDPASVHTLLPGHAPEWHAGAAADLAEFGVPAEALAVAVVGDYRPRKGIEFVVDAAQWLPPAAPVHFLLLGAGIETRSVLERIARSPFRRQFHLLGHRADAARIIAACAVAMRGSVRAEGLPRSVLEAMACGVPPLVTDSAALRELVIQGESGILVKRRSARALGEALAWLLEHPERRRAMGAAARARIAQEFSFGRAVTAHLALYRSLHEARSILHPPAGVRREENDVRDGEQ